MKTSRSFYQKFVAPLVRALRERSPFHTLTRRTHNAISESAQLFKRREDELARSIAEHEAWMREMRLKEVKSSWKHANRTQRIESKYAKQAQEADDRFWKGLNDNPRSAPFLFIRERYGKEALYPFLQVVFGFERRWNEELLSASYSDDSEVRQHEGKSIREHQKEIGARFLEFGRRLQPLETPEFLQHARRFFETYGALVFSDMPTGETPSKWSLNLEGGRTRAAGPQEEWVAQSLSRLERLFLERRIDAPASEGYNTRPLNEAL